MKHLKVIFIAIMILSCKAVFAQDQVPLKNNTEIIIYGSDQCHHCIDTKAYLKEKNIEFVFHDIDKDMEALKEMLDKLKKANISSSNLVIPVVDKKGEIIINNGDFQDFLIKLN